MINFTLDHLLAASCSNPDTNWDTTKTYDENMAQTEWNLYYIELCCVTYKISARKVSDGEMDQETSEWITPPHYEIRSVTKSDS